MSQIQLNLFQNETKNKHLTLDDRLTIQAELSKPQTFKAIGQLVGKDATTISKEIRKNRNLRKTDFKRQTPDGQLLEPEICELLLKPPYVCNACKKRRTCKMQRFMYDAKIAQKKYEDLLVESRENTRHSNSKKR